MKFTCELCGRKFDPISDAMVEWEFGSEIVPEQKALEIGITAETLESLDEWELKQMKLTPELRDALLRGEQVKIGGCICIPCQNSCEEEGAIQL